MRASLALQASAVERSAADLAAAKAADHHARAAAAAAPVASSWDIESLLPQDVPGMLPRGTMDLNRVFSLEASKRNNLLLLEPDLVLTSAGNYAVLLNMETNEQEYLVGIDGGGIGAMAAHPSKKFIAIAEKKARTLLFQSHKASFRGCLLRLVQRTTRRHRGSACCTSPLMES